MSQPQRSTQSLRTTRIKRIGIVAAVVVSAAMVYAPAAQAGFGHWFNKLYWALGGLVQEVKEVDRDVRKLRRRVRRLERQPGSDPDLQDAVTDNSAAIALLEQDLGALGERVDGLAATGGGGASGGSGGTGPVSFEALTITRLAPPEALEMSRTVFGTSQPTSCVPAGSPQPDAIPPVAITSARFQCDTSGLLFDVIVELELAGPGRVQATFLLPDVQPFGLQPERIELSGAFQAPEDGAAFAHIVTSTPAIDAPGLQRGLELALRGSVAPFEVTVNAFPEGLAGSSTVLQVEAAR